EVVEGGVEVLLVGGAWIKAGGLEPERVVLEQQVDRQKRPLLNRGVSFGCAAGGVLAAAIGVFRLLGGGDDGGERVRALALHAVGLRGSVHVAELANVVVADVYEPIARQSVDDE